MQHDLYSTKGTLKTYPAFSQENVGFLQEAEDVKSPFPMGNKNKTPFQRVFCLFEFVEFLWETGIPGRDKAFDSSPLWKLS